MIINLAGKDQSLPLDMKLSYFHPPLNKTIHILKIHPNIVIPFPSQFYKQLLCNTKIFTKRSTNFKAEPSTKNKEQL
jgi:hypothetical protein